MCKVLSEFSVEKKYKVLSVDEKPSKGTGEKYVIGGKKYTPILAYDMPSGIAIPYTSDNLVGKEVVFG